MVLQSILKLSLEIEFQPLSIIYFPTAGTMLAVLIAKTTIFISYQNIHDEETEVCFATTCRLVVTIMPFDHYSTFSRRQRVTAWIFRFVGELSRAELYWIAISRSDSFPYELCIL